MAYTPPDFNEVDFDFSGQPAYTPPDHNSIDFDFADTSVTPVDVADFDASSTLEVELPEVGVDVTDYEADTELAVEVGTAYISVPDYDSQTSIDIEIPLVISDYTASTELDAEVGDQSLFPLDVEDFDLASSFSIEIGTAFITLPEFDIDSELYIEIPSQGFQVSPFDIISELEVSIGQAISLADANLIYYFTLTGDADGLDDIEIPISSFQSRLRSGASTYLSVVIPGVEYSNEISNRINGDLIIDAAFFVGSTEVRQTIVWTHLDSIRVDEGPLNKSITLTGYRQETYTQKSITLQGSIYYNLNGDLFSYRFAKPDLFLNPGDLVTVDGITFTADLVSYYVRATNRGIQTQMDVSEAA